MRGRMLVAGALAALAAVTVACSSGSDGRSGARVAVTLHEYAIEPVPTSVPAGSVTFDAHNAGLEVHNLLVIRTDLGPGELPMQGSVALETGTLGRTDVLTAGQDQSVTVDLDPGVYVLICNVPDHYEAGMYTGFTVT